VETARFTNSAATIAAGKSCAATSGAANQLITKIGVFRPDTGVVFGSSGNGQWDGCSVDTCITSLVNRELAASRELERCWDIQHRHFQPNCGMWNWIVTKWPWDGCAVDTLHYFIRSTEDLLGQRRNSRLPEIIIGIFQRRKRSGKFDLNRNNTF